MRDLYYACFQGETLVIYVAVAMTVIIGSTAGQPLPPAFPRDGATKILENDRVIV